MDKPMVSEDSAVQKPPLPVCPWCNAALKTDKDVFCRACGEYNRDFSTHVLITCVKCFSDVHLDDAFCNTCGARQHNWVQLLRNRILSQQNRNRFTLAILGVLVSLLLALYLTSLQSI